MITAKVPFEDVYFETFGYGLGEEDSFKNDSKHEYKKSKEYLIYRAINVLFYFQNGVYLFINKKKSIETEQFIKVEEKDRG